MPGRDGRHYLLITAGGQGAPGTRSRDYTMAFALPRQANPGQQGTAGRLLGANGRRLMKCHFGRLKNIFVAGTERRWHYFVETGDPSQGAGFCQTQGRPYRGALF
jgi:hypothetical protein